MLLHLINVITAYRPNKFSKQIKKGTKEIHDNIEKHPFFIDLLSGNLPAYKYAIYLYNLLPVYSGVEMFFFNVSNNLDLLRSKSVLEDWQNYSKDLNIDFSKFNFNSEWITYFYNKPNLLKKTELYVRWLADMYGGQILAKNVRFGSKYRFNNLRNAIKTVRKLIEDGIDETNVNLFIKEANRTFDYHYKIIDKIYELTQDSL